MSVCLEEKDLCVTICSMSTCCTTILHTVGKGITFCKVQQCPGSPGSKKPVSLAGDAHMSVALYVVEEPKAI